MSALNPHPTDLTLRFGIMASQSSWGEIQSLWQEIEELGFDSAWVHDHLLRPDDEATPILEAWTLLAALAEKTSWLIAAGDLLSVQRSFR